MIDLGDARVVVRLAGLLVFAFFFGLQAQAGLGAGEGASGVLAVLVLMLIGVTAAFLIADLERDKDA